MWHSYIIIRYLLCILAFAILPVQKAYTQSAVATKETKQDLLEIFGKAEYWNTDPEIFIKNHHNLGFSFVDRRKTATSTNPDKLRFLGLKAYEVRIDFGPQNIKFVDVSIYNKGDAGTITQKEFEALVISTKNKIDEFTGHGGFSVRPSSPRPNYFVYRHQWGNTKPAFQLEWAFVAPHRSGGRNIEYNAEYIKVMMAPSQAAAASAQTAMSGAELALRMQDRQSILSNVQQEENGDLWIDNIPMVDQGQKGYCAAATSERVLRYYGLAVDQHQIAQIAETAAEGGTTLEGMSKAIINVGQQFRLDKEDLIPADSSNKFEGSNYDKIIKQYNKMASRNKKPQIDWKTFVTGNAIDIPRIWAAMDKDILRDARVNRMLDYKRFTDNIKRYTRQGVPIFWSCMVGIYPEYPGFDQAEAFGHVRLIIGYNEKNDEILYSDTWGPAHSLKRMSRKNAWAMTQGLFVLKPRNIR
jgi:hypothetical protein